MSKKVAVLGITNLKHMSLISLYTSIFNENGIMYDLIYIDKYNIEEKNTARNVYKYKSNNETNSIFGKIKHTIRFKKYAEKTLRENKYDFVIVWREQTAAIFADFLRKHYFQRYCVNIRDLWSKYNVFITVGLKKALKGSNFNTIASEGFLSYLPSKYQYLFINSVNIDILKSVENVSIKRNRDVIKIKSIGTFRNDSYFFKLVDSLANDRRFEIHFIGQGSERMARYCSQHGYDNVFCSGTFSPDQTSSFLLDADIINCSSGKEDRAEECKIPIRFYYAVYNNLPILTTEQTFLSKMSSALCLNIDIPKIPKVEDQIGNVIYNAMKNFDYERSRELLGEYKTHIMDGHNLLKQKVMGVLGDD